MPKGVRRESDSETLYPEWLGKGGERRTVLVEPNGWRFKKMAIGSSVSTTKTRTYMNFVLIGPNNSGKSVLAHTYCGGYFEVLCTTIGTITFPKKTDDGLILIRDTGAGEIESKFLSFCCCSDADAVILCYSITDENSFEGIASWIPKCNIAEDVVIVMAGCKADLEDMRQVSLGRAKEMANNLFPKHSDIKVFETSAKTGQNVVQIFDFTISEVLKAKRKKGQVISSVQLEDTTPVHQKDTSADCLLL